MCEDLQIKLDANNELIAYGLTNIVGSIFGCYPSFGSFVRNKLTKLIGANA